MEKTSSLTTVGICGAVFVGLLIALQFLSGSPEAQAAGQPKIDICHYDADTGTYHTINVSNRAEKAHRNHGDTVFGDPCTVGTGACAAAGTVNGCTASGPTCSAVPGTPAADDSTCNGIDDDCDGLVDEDYVSQPTSCGTGVCSSNGSTSCVNGAVVDSCTPGPAGIESCNNLDDDCDGTVDGMTGSCYSGPVGSDGVGACHAGSQACTAGVWGACSGQVVPASEQCNTLDDDCDGVTDEGGVCPV